MGRSAHHRGPAWRLGAFAVLAAVAAGCGGAGPAAPTAAFAPGAEIDAGTVLSLTGADDGAPAAGAEVLVAGRAYASDGDGRVVLDRPVTSGTLVDISAAGMLQRQTMLRSPAFTAFSLWPRVTASGLDEGYTRDLVYTWDGSPGASPLYRIAGTQAFLVPSPELQADVRAMAAHRHAAEQIATAVGGAVRYAVSAQPPAGAVAFATVVDPRDEGCKERVLALTTIRLRAGEISSGRIVFCTREASGDGTILHEVGHTFGLGHSPDADEVMHAFKLYRQPEAFGPRESLVMRLMLQRRGGNRFPDNDRGVTAAAEGERRISCPER